MTKSTHIPTRKLLMTMAALAALVMVAPACGSASGAGAPSEQTSAAIAAAEPNETQLVLTQSVESTQFFDTADGTIRELADVVTGDRSVLLWYWAPHCATCRGHAADVAQFALEHNEVLQVVGVGSQDDFELTQDFLDTTGTRDSEVLTMLWEGSGNIWGLNDVRTNSAMQLFTHDLTQGSGIIFFNDDGRSIVLDAAIQEPWAPADAPYLLGS